MIIQYPNCITKQNMGGNSMNCKIFIKKLIVLLLLCTVSLTMDLTAQENPEGKGYSNKKLEHPLLQEVFPGLGFFIEISHITTPPSKRIVCNDKDLTYQMVEDFNLLFYQVKEKSKAGILDRIELFVWLSHIILDENLIVNPVNPTMTNFENKTFQYVVDLVVFGKDYTVFISVEEDQIARAEVFLNEVKQSVIKPKLFNGGSKSIDVSISGISPEQYWGKNHYYIPVSENGTATNNSITFNVSGLLPNQENVSVKINPVYGYVDSFLDQLLVIDENGNASYNWKPENTTNTGICEIQIDEDGTITDFQDILIIPEKTLTGSFNSGYDFTIYYTDQFFTLHPNGIDHALSFTTFVKDALEASWNKQVLEWDLCEGIAGGLPVDNDNNFQVFINDAEYATLNIYHGSFQTGSSTGNERANAIGNRLYQIYNAYSFEENLIFSILSNQFYHGIEWSGREVWF